MIDSDNPWGVRWANVRPPSTYMKNLKNNNSVTVMNEHLTREKSLEDRLLMGLRLSEGLDIRQICDIYMAEFNLKKIDYLAKDGFLKYDDDYIKLTSKGRLQSNRVILKVLESFNFLSQVKLSEGF